MELLLMSRQELQQQLEEQFDINKIDTTLYEYKEGVEEKCREYIDHWLSQDFDFSKRPDLIHVVNSLYQLNTDELCWQLWSTVIVNKEISLQHAFGLVFEKIGKYVEMPYRRGHVLNILLCAVCSTNTVTVERKGKYNYLVSKVHINKPEQDRYGYILPSLVKHIPKNNNKASYDNKHAITGGRLKTHDNEVCLDHLARLSSIPYQVETRIQQLTQPIFEDAAKYKERLGRFETEEEIEDRRIAFQRFKHELPNKIYIMLSHGNEFYLGHCYDTRLRTYLKAYHFDFVGNKYCRAFVQPKTGAYVDGVQEYL